MKKLLLLLLCIPFFSAAQDIPVFNLDFEMNPSENVLPEGWFKWGTPDFVAEMTEEQIQNGSVALKIAPTKSDIEPNSFGCAAYRIPAKYAGQTIELSGYIKMDNVENGYVGLLLRIDGESGQLGFDNMAKQDINGTADWKKYQITLPYPEGASWIIVGGILTGTGQAWFDNFEVKIDGKNIANLKPVEPKKFPAELDTEFDEGSKIDNIVLTPEKIKALTTLGKIWGFAKYYHPKIATGEVNWDYELFRVLPKYLEAEGRKAQGEVVVDWLNQLGEFEKISRIPVPTDREIKLRVDIDWFEDALSGDVMKLLEDIFNARRPNKHFYMGFFPNVGNPKILHENTYEQFKYPDAGFRLLAVYRYWNIIQYFFPYKHLTDQKWSRVLEEFIPKFVNAKNELEYKLAALELIGKVQDTHANIWQRDEALGSFFGHNTVPAKVQFIENQAVITDFFTDEKGNETGLEIGDIITKINGKKVEDIIKSLQPYSPASNYPTQLRDISRKIFRTNEEKLDVDFLRNGKSYNITITTKNRNSINTRGDQPKSWKELDGDIGYMYPGSLQGSDLSDLLEAFKNKKGIVVDLRCYPSEFIVFSFGSFLMPKPTPFVKFTQGNLDLPGKFEFSKNLSVGNDNPDYFKGKVAILINETTQSQAEYTTMALRVAPQAKVFGSTTAGADGNVSTFYLPGNIRTMISGIGVYYPNGKETQRIGIVPDEEVHPTIQGIKDGRDEVLEKALEWLKE